ncbi:MFS general substrate transporter [Conidiobolus coronatus NRRL 28638]|uniref:MFS general substrate transporter n=1 Tax=Conidiobolus coronatus (strain ATCC 28846 / CBS 209.66 / NRRL 28638) TaxID=796925 RepID=A0A137P0H7_CONC2|nr:MFS general substrate transporter [Conidiobolus coronatus NRRL 28638]|eukprot:KXN68482.1 MFS general substrate transporter [Conidiobolus coronatus NRRL 28638]
MKTQKSLSTDINAAEIGQLHQIDEKAQLDSRFSWLMVAAGLMLHFVTFGTMGSFGIYLAEYSKSQFSDQPKSVLSLVGSLGPAIIAVFTVPSGILVSKLGYRVNIIVGAILMGLGLVISSFAQQVWTLFLGQAIILGVAVSLCFVPAVCIVPQWLDKYRGLGVGICSAGTGIGGLILAPLLQTIIDSLGWRWALRINGIICTIVLVICALVLKPRVPFQPPKNIIDLEIIKNPKFISLWCMGACSCFSYWVPFFIMPLYCYHFGIEASTASLIVGTMSGASAVGRVLIGKLSDKMGNINTLLISNFICALSFILIWSFATNTWSLIVFSLVYGTFSGAFFTSSILIAPQLFGLEKLPQVSGLYYTYFGPGYLTGAAIATSIINLYTVGDYINYVPCMFYLFGCYFASCIFIVLLRVQITKTIFEKI